jgi:L-glutamine:2-deoxy-scyllo-inosose/3-amino-2,3-dideoxy-scyllo-inosose aminotransferase
MEALDIGAGDEVIVPVVTWVACASAVLRVGAIPVLVDIDPETGCLSPDAVVDALSERTRAILVVHLGSTVADLTRIKELAARHDLAVIEDCAQAHGAIWNGRQVGTFGDIGAFSFQSGKVLAAGEGGAVITDREDLWHRAQQLRADGRAYRRGLPVAGQMELHEFGDVTGANHCMSELAAAIAIDQLARLDDDHARRTRFVGVLEAELARSGGTFFPVAVAPEVERRSVYEYAIRFRPGTFGEVPVATVASALAAELGRPVYPNDAPLNRSALFKPETTRRFALTWSEQGRARALGRQYPAAEAFVANSVLIHHSALLGSGDDVADIVTALSKVVTHQAELAAAGS